MKSRWKLVGKATLHVAKLSFILCSTESLEKAILHTAPLQSNLTPHATPAKQANSSRHRLSYKYTRFTLPFHYFMSSGTFTKLFSFCNNISLNSLITFGNSVTMAENVSRRGLEGKEKEESGRQDGQVMRPATTNTQSQSAYPNAAQKATLVDKIKEMLPGSQTDQAQSDHSKPNEAEAQTAYPDAAQKATLLDKVKDLLPESQTETKAQTVHSNPNEAETQTAYPNAAQKATLVDKIKDILPGSQTETEAQTAHSKPNQTQTETQTQTGYPNAAQKATLVDKVEGMFTGGQTETDTETAQSNPNQKAGLVDKIKENIPRAQNKE